MKWRFWAFAIWLAVTAVLLLIALSDYVFGESTGRQLLTRAVLILVWPLAMMSSSGRVLMFNLMSKTGKGV